MGTVSFVDYALLDWGRSTYKRRDVVVRQNIITSDKPSTRAALDFYFIQSPTMQSDYDIANNV